MAPDMVHLPNGHSLSVKPVFGGLFFKPSEQNIHNAVFPTGWTIILQSEAYVDAVPSKSEENQGQGAEGSTTPKKHRIHRFTKPTLQNDCLFISSISFPNSSDFKAPASPTRLVAMMLWATLYWYFHQPEPSPFVTTEASKNTPDNGKPKADWRINIKREGVFRGRNLLPKLERMGLIYSESSAVGANNNGVEGWEEMFTSRRAFWQLSARLFLFTLSPNAAPSSSAGPSSIPGSPYPGQPTSPVRVITDSMEELAVLDPYNSVANSASQVALPVLPMLPAPHVPGPFASGSHLPTYYPPAPMQYINTNGVRHPIRQKPPQQGESFYTRYIPSLDEHLSFRVASLSNKPVPYTGPEPTPTTLAGLPSRLAQIGSRPSSPIGPTSAQDCEPDTRQMTDVQLLHKWMNEPRVAKFWGCAGPAEVQEKFLRDNLESKHSFPAIGLWDGKPFGYFEIYWVKEDTLGKILNAGEAKDWDRGVHVLVGEQEFRGAHRLNSWITSLVHWSLTVDYRTECLVLEPRIDNERFIQLLENAGFTKEKQITFPHKTSWYMRFKRETFDGPSL